MVGGIALVAMALYFAWNTVGSATILRVKGHYFLSLLPLLLVNCTLRVRVRVRVRLLPDAARVRLFGRIVVVVAVLEVLVLNTLIVTTYLVFRDAV